MNRFELAKYIECFVRPGKHIEVSFMLMREIDCIPGWTAAESVMEDIVGSAYEFSFTENPQSGNVIFSRREKPLMDGSRTYVSPDRRHLGRLCDDGLWRSRSG